MATKPTRHQIITPQQLRQQLWGTLRTDERWAERKRRTRSRCRNVNLPDTHSPANTPGRKHLIGPGQIYKQISLLKDTDLPLQGTTKESPQTALTDSHCGKNCATVDTSQHPCRIPISRTERMRDLDTKPQHELAFSSVKILHQTNASIWADVPGQRVLTQRAERENEDHGYRQTNESHRNLTWLSGAEKGLLKRHT